MSGPTQQSPRLSSSAHMHGHSRTPCTLANLSDQTFPHLSHPNQPLRDPSILLRLLARRSCLSGSTCADLEYSWANVGNSTDMTSGQMALTCMMLARNESTCADCLSCCTIFARALESGTSATIMGRPSPLKRRWNLESMWLASGSSSRSRA